MSKYVISRKSLESYIDFLRQSAADDDHRAAVRGDRFFSGMAAGLFEAAERLESTLHMAEVKEPDDA